MLEQFDHIETKNLGCLLLRSFVASPHLANSARCLGLKGIHFDRVGFDWWVDDLLKGLFVEGRRNIARLRQELPDLFDVLDRGGPIITSDDTVRALTKWFIDEAHYLDGARDLGLSDRIDIADRNRRRDVEIAGARTRRDSRGSGTKRVLLWLGWMSISSRDFRG